MDIQLHNLKICSHSSTAASWVAAARLDEKIVVSETKYEEHSFSSIDFKEFAFMFSGRNSRTKMFI